MTSGMAGRYASALFALAEEQGSLEGTAADLDTFAALMDESADLRRLVRSPAFSAQEQMRALTAILERAGIGGLAGNFLKLTASKRRLFAVEQMIDAFHALRDDKLGTVQAEVTLAEPLSDEHLATIQTALSEAANARSVRMKVKIDPSLIGGLAVRIGSRMVDASLRTKLATLRTRMKEVR